MPDIIIRKKTKLPADHVAEVELMSTEYSSLSVHNPYRSGQVVLLCGSLCNKRRTDTEKHRGPKRINVHLKQPAK
jgi:hypothetical protein